MPSFLDGLDLLRLTLVGVAPYNGALVSGPYQTPVWPPAP